MADTSGSVQVPPPGQQNQNSNRGGPSRRRPRRGRGGGSGGNNGQRNHGDGSNIPMNDTTGQSWVDGQRLGDTPGGPAPRNVGSASQNEGAPRQPRRNRRGKRGGGDGGQRLGAAPGGEVSNGLPDHHHHPQQQQQQQSRGGPSYRRGGRGRGGSSYVAPRRAFGGKMSSMVDEAANAEANSGGHSDDGEATLRPEAAVFEPGQVAESTQAAAPPKRVRGRNKAAKPQTVKEAEDLMTRIHQGIASGQYECMICYGGVTRRGKVWDCDRCYAVFHLNCIQKWAKQALDQTTPQHENELLPKKFWRCPGCQHQYDAEPAKYTCWCGNTESPEMARYIPPHSCGQTCRKPREVPKGCPHNCDLQCHAGPCPPCTAMGPQQPCFCGKEVSQKRCQDTNYEEGWCCMQECGDIMPCGEHICERPCHSGLCGECTVKEDLRCYCGVQSKEIQCCDKLDPMVSEKEEGSGVESWEGYWECGKSCERLFDCGIHRCQKQCHAQDLDTPDCPRSPDVVEFCPCGKTPLDPLKPRQSCEDPIPHCDKPCGKILKCGHECERTCHSDDCGTCLKYIDVACRCGRTMSRSLCHQGNEIEPPLCCRVCQTNLNCMRHQCTEKCCGGEKAARERLAKKKRPLMSAQNTRADDNVEPEHICTRPCGKSLKCGKHNCNMLCHRGPCGSCLEASFEELYCNCGKTKINPPVPCGSKPPPCRYQCTRPKACGHPRQDHNCHGDDEECPKCPWLVDKTCVCGRKTMKNQPCWRETVSCGQECGGQLSCGVHKCQRKCHLKGYCDEPCKQTCAKPKPTCGHPCQEACHAPFQCSTNTPCTSKVALMCPCGNVRQEVKCSVTKNNPNPKRPEVKCIDDCRRKQIAAAFNKDLEAEKAKEGCPYSEDVMEFYIANKAWCTSVEKNIRDFCLNNSKQRLNFQPMRKPQREFIHVLCEDYGLVSESEDPEPHRSVVVHKNSDFAIPSKSLAEALATIPKTAPAVDAGPQPTAIQQLRKTNRQAVNAIVLSGLRLGLLKSELEKELESVLRDSQLRYTVRWAGDEEAVIEPKPSSFTMDEIEMELTNQKPQVKRHCMVHKLATSAELCWVGRDGKVACRESQRWSVVGSGSNPARSAPPISQQHIANKPNSYGLLSGTSFAKAAASAAAPPKRSAQAAGSGSKLVLSSKKQPEEEVVDDWEVAADSDEAEEMKNTSSGEDGGVPINSA